VHERQTIHPHAVVSSVASVVVDNKSKDNIFMGLVE